MGPVCHDRNHAGHYSEGAEPVMGADGHTVVHQGEKKQARKEGGRPLQDALRDRGRNPSQPDPKQDHHQIRNPGARPEGFEQAQVHQVGPGRSKLKEVSIDQFSPEHSRGIRDKKTLVASDQDRGARQKK